MSAATVATLISVRFVFGCLSLTVFAEVCATTFTVLVYKRKPVFSGAVAD